MTRRGYPAADQTPGVRAVDHAHNRRIDDGRYNQQWVCETVNSVIKRSYGAALRTRTWYRQFSEITFAATVYNVERAIKQ